MSAKRKLAMSGVAILVVLTLVAGATMAWFIDTEKVNANFKAGILDISVSDGDASVGTELNFENMRPMEEDTAIAEMTDTLNGDRTESTYEEEGFKNPTVYVQQFAISNDGTLPVNVKLSFEEVDPAADDKNINIVANGNGGIRREGEVDCHNELGKWYYEDEAEQAVADDPSNRDIYNAKYYRDQNTKLHFVLFKNDAEKGWQVVNEDISLKTLLKINNANGVELDGIIPAGATAENNTYALGAYLDKTAGNEYQNKEYHVNFIVNAKQVDKGATYADEA